MTSSYRPVLRRRWIFLAFLVVLHLVFMQGPTTQLGRLLLLVHIGLGLLWQPFVQPRRGLGFMGTAFVVLAAAFFAYFLSWGMLLVWTMLLTGVVGGKVFMFHDRWERMFHLFALGYLVMVVLALILPQSLMSLKLAGPETLRLVLTLAPAVFLVMAILPVGGGVMDDRVEIVDYVYGVLVFLLLAVIVLGSLSFSLLFSGYFESLLMTLALVAGILLLLGFIWDPRSGFGGLGSAVAQHVMSLGLPLEDWLESLAELARNEPDHVQFMELACRELPKRLPGVIGGNWQVRGSRGSFGAAGGHAIRFAYGELRICLLTRTEPSPSLLWHYDLVVRLLAEIHLGKWRAEELKRLSYIEAIHETGARLTHDVKNLLQSLDTLCVAAEHEAEQPSARFRELLRRQLPEIAVRLRQTLAKLSTPGAREPARQPMPAPLWLQSIKARYSADWIDIAANGAGADCGIADPELFSSIAENLLHNVISKRHAEPNIRAELRLAATAEGATLDVSDSGSPIRPEVAGRLFSQRVASENGLGIGLYQCAQHAAAAGYQLELAENRRGCVRFRLAPAHRGSAAGR